MNARLAQVCLFKHDGTALRRFCDLVSGEVETDDGDLLSYRMGGASVAHHPPMGDLEEDDVLVTLEAVNSANVDGIYAKLERAGLVIDDQPEDTEWGYRVFYFRAAPHLVFEIVAPLPQTA
jgi:hypothetical protein